MIPNPLKLLKHLAPLAGIVIGKNPEDDSPLTKNWRPVVMVTFAVLIVVSFFTSFVISEELLILIGLVMTAYVGGRSWEKSIPKILEVLLKRSKEKEE